MITLSPCQEEAVARVYEHLRTRDDNPYKATTCLDRSSWSFSRSALSLSFAAGGICGVNPVVGWVRYGLDWEFASKTFVLNGKTKLAKNTRLRVLF